MDTTVIGISVTMVHFRAAAIVSLQANCKFFYLTGSVLLLTNVYAVTCATFTQQTATKASSTTVMGSTTRATISITHTGTE